MKVTIDDVARYAGVSKSTVSRFLNNVPSAMSPQTSERVAEAIERLGYKPNLVARSLKAKATSTIAVLVANILNPYSIELTQGIENVCNQHNYNMILCNTEDSSVKEQKYMEVLMAKQIDGFIIQPAEGDTRLLARLLKNSPPVVLVDRTVPQSDVSVDAVVINNRESARDAVEYLISLGHRRIAALIPALYGVTSRQDRIAGYFEALRESQIKVDQDLVKIFQPGKGSADRAVTELLKLSRPPSALVAMNGWTALNVLGSLKELQCRIPDDISLVGFDDPQWAKLVDPPLTVVAQPASKIGEVAATLLFERLVHRRTRRSAQTMVLRTEFIIRRSCAAFTALSSSPIERS